MSAIYPWEALEEALERNKGRSHRYDPGVLSRQVLNDLEDAGWRLVKEEPDGNDA